MFTKMIYHLEALFIVVVFSSQAYAQADKPPAAASVASELAAKCASVATLWPGVKGGPGATDEAVELCTKACDAGDAVSCSSLAFTLDQRMDCVASEDRGKCAELYKKACDKECLIGCVGYAENLTFGVGDAGPDFKLAEKHMKKACDAGIMVGCFKLGKLKLNPEAGTPDSKRGVTLIDKACQGKHGPACADLSFRYSVGDGVAKDPAKAEKYDALACQFGAGLDRPGSSEFESDPEEE